MYDFLLALLFGALIALLVNRGLFQLIFNSRDDQDNLSIIETVVRRVKAHYASIVFAWKFSKKKRLLDIHDHQSRDVKKLGLVASELEEHCEGVQPLTSQKVCLVFCYIFKIATPVILEFICSH